MLQNRTMLITGIASERSIAYGIAKACHGAGAQLILTYQSDMLKQRVEKIAKSLNAYPPIELDVNNDNSLATLAERCQQYAPTLDGIVHAIAYAEKSQLEGEFTKNITREGFQTAHNISSYSFAAIAKQCTPLLSDTASLLTLTYIGSQRTMPSYNTMGCAKASLEAMVRYMAYDLGKDNIRVNAISAGGIRTLAASGIKGFKQLLKHQSHITPLKQTLTIDHIGQVALFLLSPMSCSVTGDIIYADNGFHLIGGALPQETL